MNNIIYEEISSIIIADGNLDNYNLLNVTSIITKLNYDDLLINQINILDYVNNRKYESGDYIKYNINLINSLFIYLYKNPDFLNDIFVKYMEIINWNQLLYNYFIKLLLCTNNVNIFDYVYDKMISESYILDETDIINFMDKKGYNFDNISIHMYGRFYCIDILISLLNKVNDKDHFLLNIFSRKKSFNTIGYIELCLDNYAFDIIFDIEKDIGYIYNFYKCTNELLENIIIYQLEYIDYEIIEKIIIDNDLDINKLIDFAIKNSNYEFLDRCINSNSFKLNNYDILLQLSRKYFFYSNKKSLIKVCFNKLFNYKKINKDQIDKLFYNSVIYSNIFIFEKLLRYYKIYNHLNLPLLFTNMTCHKICSILIVNTDYIDYNNPKYFLYYLKKYFILRFLIKNNRLSNNSCITIFNMIKNQSSFNYCKKYILNLNIISFNYELCDLLYKTKAYDALNIYLINNYHIHNISFLIIKEKYNNIITANKFYFLLIKLKINDEEGLYIYKTVYKKFRWKSHTIKYILKNIKNLLCF
jgi:hypothetical protein